MTQYKVGDEVRYKPVGGMFSSDIQASTVWIHLE